MQHTAYTAREIIDLLGMAPHQEGGWYAFVTTSGVSLPDGFLPAFDGARDTCSIIYYLLQRGEISRWHQLQASEVWAWHMGGSLEMTLGGTGERPEPEGKLRQAEGWRASPDPGPGRSVADDPAGGGRLCSGLLHCRPGIPG